MHKTRHGHVSSRLRVYFQKLPNIYGTLIHCENLKIIEIMFTVQIIIVKSIHYVEMVMFTAQI